MSQQRIFNFSAGPATLPESVLQTASDNLLSLGGTGIGILEHSHRGRAFLDVIEGTEERCRRLAGIPDDYHVLFLQGGASSQFALLPMNFLPQTGSADYLITGSWSRKAVQEARRFGQAREACSSADRNFCYIPRVVDHDPDAAYAHFTSNNTIFGTQFQNEPSVAAPLVCDASSDIFSRPIDVTRYGMIYAGAQKNLGPSGVTLVILSESWLQKSCADLPSMFSYATHAKSRSMYNTPPTFGIYLMGLVFEWMEAQGGLEGMAERNAAKAALLYDFLDQSRLFQATADPDSRSRMNVTFVTGDAGTDASFIATAAKAGLDGLKGHRSVGGMRASIYNAFPLEGVARLVEVMSEFERTRS